MPKIDLDSIQTLRGSGYPGPLNDGFEKRLQKRLGDAAGLSQFGVNLVTLEPGGMSSLRHWHENQDEFLIVTEGILTLIDDHGETLLEVGDCAAFPAGDANGHHVVNKSALNGSFLVVGTRTPTEIGWYSDLDLKVEARGGQFTFTKRDGSPL